MSEKKKTRSPRTLLNITPEDFIRIWQSSATVDDVCAAISKKSGGAATASQSVRQRARAYRLKGVPLKEMPRVGGGARDWKALSDLARQAAKGGEKGK